MADRVIERRVETTAPPRDTVVVDRDEAAPRSNTGVVIGLIVLLVILLLLIFGRGLFGSGGSSSSGGTSTGTSTNTSSGQ